MSTGLPRVRIWVILALMGVPTWIGATAYLSGTFPLGDDHSSHLALCVHLSELFRSGATDFFWGDSNLGIPLFVSYQPLPSLVTASILAMFENVAPAKIFKLVVLLGWSTLQIPWYLGSRWCGASSRMALLVGLFTISIHSQWHMGLTLTASGYEGLFTQLWGVWLFPLALGSFNRCVMHGKRPWMAASLLLAITVMSHLFIGLLCAIACACVGAVEPKRLVAIWRRIGLHLISTFALCSFWLIPLLAYRDYLGGLPWLNDTYDGWGLGQTIRAMGSGALCDHERWPWLTSLACAGLSVGILRCRHRSMFWACLLFGVLSIGMLGGREVWGDTYASIPMHAHVNPTRYLTALQMLYAVSAAFACSWFYHTRMQDRLPRWVVFGWFSALVVAWGVGQHERSRAVLNSLPDADAFHRIAGQLADDRGHRFAVYAEYGTGSHFHRDLLPMLSGRAQLQSYALGYHATPSTYYAEFMGRDVVSMRLFNVSTLLSRNAKEPPEGLQFHRQIGPYRTYRVPDTADWGYFDVVRPGGVATGSLRALRPLLREAAPIYFARGEVIRLAKDRAQAPALQTIDSGSSLEAPAGSINSSDFDALGYWGNVSMVDDGLVMLKVNYFPFWQAEVDGQLVEIEHIAPNFMAVAVPKGTHDVTFRYRNPPLQKWGAVGALLFAIALFGAYLQWSIKASSRRHKDLSGA